MGYEIVQNFVAEETITKLSNDEWLPLFESQIPFTLKNVSLPL